MQDQLTRNAACCVFPAQADNFAVKQGKGASLMAGLVKISKDNKSNANPDPLFSAYHHTHPALVERLDAISTAIFKSGKED